MNFPTARAIADAVVAGDHNPRCSFAQTNGALLCDCHVLTKHPLYVAEYGTNPNARCCGCAGGDCCNHGEAPCSTS